MHERQKDWPWVAAFYAEDFFHHPGLQAFQALQKAAERAGVGPAVRAAALHYLETGESFKKAKGRGMPSWPLPETGLPAAAERQKLPAPMTEILIDIAIAEKRPDDVIRWYDQRKLLPVRWEYGWSRDDRIAKAVVGAYPDRALAIWKEMAESQIGLTNVRAYETAAGYLRKVHRTLKKLGKEQEWQEYLAALRQTNARKPRLVEILDGLGGRRIID